MWCHTHVVIGFPATVLLPSFYTSLAAKRRMRDGLGCKRSVPNNKKVKMHNKYWKDREQHLNTVNICYGDAGVRIALLSGNALVRLLEIPLVLYMNVDFP